MSAGITRKRLKNYRKLMQEIAVLEYELDEMLKGSKGIGHSTILNGFYWPPKPEAVVGFEWDLFEHRKEILVRKKEEAEAIRTWIDSIEDGQTRCVFRMFYIEGMTWVQIAKEIGYQGNEDYPRLYIRDKYLKKCGIR